MSGQSDDVDMTPIIKRNKMIDIEGREILKTKRRRIDNIDLEGKTTAITFMLRLCYGLVKMMKIEPSLMNEVIASTIIYGLAFRIYHYFRIKNSGVKSDRMEKMKKNQQSIFIKGTEYSITMDEIHTIETEIFIGIGKTSKEDKANFFAAGQTTVALMALFGARLRELQIGPDRWVVNKANGEVTERSATSAGVPPCFRHFLTGLSYDVNVRSTLSAHIGGLAHAVQLSLMPSNSPYKNKSEIGFERAYNFIPQIDVITKFIVNHPARDNVPIITRLASITALHGDKHKRKIALPFSIIWQHCVEIKEQVIKTHKQSDIGFSSKRATYLYNKYPVILIPNERPSQIIQIYFHAVFGTHGEDFGVLQTITNKASGWLHRGQMNEAFQHLKGTSIIDTGKQNAIKINYYSKSISASQTNMLSTGTKALGIQAVFSGIRKKHFSDLLLNTVCKQRMETSVQFLESSAPSICSHLDGIIDIIDMKIQESKKEGKTIEFGTSDWYETSSATLEKDGNKAILNVEEIGDLYWNSKE